MCCAAADVHGVAADAGEPGTDGGSENGMVASALILFLALGLPVRGGDGEAVAVVGDGASGACGTFHACFPQIAAHPYNVSSSVFQVYSKKRRSRIHIRGRHGLQQLEYDVPYK